MVLDWFWLVSDKDFSLSQPSLEYYQFSHCALWWTCEANKMQHCLHQRLHCLLKQQVCTFDVHIYNCTSSWCTSIWCTSTVHVPVRTVSSTVTSVHVHVGSCCANNKLLTMADNTRDDIEPSWRDRGDRHTHGPATQTPMGLYNTQTYKHTNIHQKKQIAADTAVGTNEHMDQQHL